MMKIKHKLIAMSLRKQWKKSDDNRDKDNVISDKIEVIKDLSYGKYGKWNLLDVNKPKDAEGKLPCIVSMHGGGFFYGTKETYRFYAANLAERGFVVINYNYRLSPENAFPAPLEDANNVMLWIEKNAETYNIDTNNIFFVGDSAGGNLVYNYTEIVTNPEYATLYDFKPSKLKPNAVAMNCAVYNLSGDKKDFTYDAYVQNKEKYGKYLLLGNYLTKDFPPSFMMSAPNDFLLNQLQPNADFFTSKGVTVVAKTYGTKEDPAACHVFHVNLKLDIAKQCNDDECNFFKGYLK
ncbi:MAG: alpha/beta hydrolase [Treponema sp.]|nr:alpha/beta hydrolase [Treponema sp.]